MNQMYQMYMAKLLIDGWATGARHGETAGRPQPQTVVDRRKRASRQAPSLLRKAGHRLSILGSWLEQHGDPRKAAHDGEMSYSA